MSFPAGGGGGLEFPTPAGGSISTAAMSRTIPPPHWIRPPQASEVNIDTSGTGFNNATTPVVLAGSAFQIPADNVGVIRSVVLSVNNLTTTSQLVWRLRFNGVGVQGWNNLTIFPRLAASISVAYGPDETFIPIPDGVLIDVELVVLPADGNTYQAGVSYHGWYYGKELAEAFDQVYRP